MTASCLFCASSTSVRAIGAMIAIGHPARPTAAVLCRGCAVLCPSEPTPPRDRVMARALRDAVSRRYNARG